MSLHHQLNASLGHRLTASLHQSSVKSVVGSSINGVVSSGKGVVTLPVIIVVTSGSLLVSLVTRNNLKIDIRIHYIELKFLLPFEELVDATVGATVEGAVGLPVDCSTIGACA